MGYRISANRYSANTEKQQLTGSAGHDGCTKGTENKRQKKQVFPITTLPEKPVVQQTGHRREFISLFTS